VEAEGQEVRASDTLLAVPGRPTVRGALKGAPVEQGRGCLGWTLMAGQAAGGAGATPSGPVQADTRPLHLFRGERRAGRPTSETERDPRDAEADPRPALWCWKCGSLR